MVHILDKAEERGEEKGYREEINLAHTDYTMNKQSLSN